MKDIKFGTSGWRAIISEDFTFTNVRLVVQAIADYVKRIKEQRAKIKIVVGYDTRFLSKEFAQEAANLLSYNDIYVLLCNRDTPTPVISYHIIKNCCTGGINFTASHNPPEYNGIKFSPLTGGPASNDVTDAIESNIARLKKKKWPKGPYQAKKSLIKVFAPHPLYLKRIENIIDFDAIKKARLKIAVDCMYGTSRGYLDYLLKKYNCRIKTLHDYLNPYFNGKRPEPAVENIQGLISLVCRERLDIGLATDGDADRFGILDSDGTYITPNQVITLLFYHLLKTRKGPANIVARTIATTHMIDAIAKRHNIEVIETPVGFKYFVDVLKRGDCIIAGEESGGLSISSHLPEKDGILACLLITEMVAINRKPIKAILSYLYKTYGRFYSERVDFPLKELQKSKLMDKLRASDFKEVAGIRISKRDLRDGCKLYLEDGSWLLFRPSGTEPVVRSYVESMSKRTLSRLITEVRELACKFI